MNTNWPISMMMVLAVAAAALALPVTDGLIIHLEADRLVLNDGDTVAFWPDSSVTDGADGSVKSAANAALPTFKLSGYNGMPAVHFDDVAQQALMSDIWSWDNTKGVCVILLCTGGEANTDRAFHVGNVNGLNFKTLGCDVSSVDGIVANGSGVRFNNGWTCTSDVSPNPIVQGQWQTSIRQFGPAAAYGSLFYAVDSVTQVEVGSNQPTRTLNFDNDNNVISVGNGRSNNTSGWVGGTDWYNGDVAEVLVYNDILTTDEMQQILDYLDDKYNQVTAHNPSPAHGSIGQGVVAGQQIQVTLSWNTGLDAAGAAPDSRIAEHQLYLSQDPTFASASPIVMPAGDPVEATASYGPVVVDLDATYYWRVDEAYALDPNVVGGQVWTFDTLKAVPVINTQPADAVAFVGGEATYSLEAFSLSPLSYEWFHSTDAVNDTPDDDTAVATTEVLTLTDIQASDEGYYYCKVTNAGGTVVSGTAKLGVKRLVAHYTLDTADLVGKQYLDSSGEDNHVDPADPNLVGQFVPGVDPTETNEALDLTFDAEASGRTASWIPTFGTGEVTISAWVNWSGLAAWPWQGLVNSRGSAVDPQGDVRNFLVEIEPGGTLRINVAGTVILSEILPVGQWRHVAFTAAADRIIAYVDGVPVGSAPAGAAVPENSVPLYLGMLSRNGLGPVNTFNGLMDDVRIYSYAMTHTEVIDLYYDISETGVCAFPSAIDVAGGGVNGDEPDCYVNLADIAVFAGKWLECGLYPQIECP